MRLTRGTALTVALVRFGHRRPWLTVGVAALVVLAGIVFGTRITFETDVMALVPRHDPVVQTFTRTLEEFGSLETLLVAIPIPDEDHLEQSLALVDMLAPELARSPYLAEVQSRLEDPVQLADAVLHHAVLFLDRQGLATLQQRLTTKGLQERAADIRASLETPLGMVAKEFVTRDPVGFLPLLLNRVTKTPSALRVDYSSGYYLSADHSLVLILAKPVRPAQDIAFDEALFKDLRQRSDEVRRRLAEEDEVPVDEVPSVLLGGGHRIALEDASLIRSDIIVNSMTSILGVMLLFFLAYRRFATVHYAFLPLAVGLALTFIFTAVALGRLNSATSGFSALLVGLGIDFTIVMYGRYLEGRHAGLSLDAALEEMARGSGPAVLLGAVTSVGTFYAFLVTRFAGLRELGLLTGTGIILMALTAFLLLPALVTIFDRGRTPPALSRWLNIAPLLRWAERRRRVLLGIAGALTLVSLALVPTVRFDDDVRNLRSPSNKGVEIQQLVAHEFGLSFNAMMIRVQAADLAGAMEKVQRITDGLDGMVRAGIVSSYESLANLYPPRVLQEQALQWVEDHRELTEPLRVRRELAAAFVAQGLVPGAFEQGFAILEDALRPSGPLGLEVWKGTPVEHLVERSIHVEDHSVATVINVFPPPGEWRRQAPPPLVELVASVDGASLTGINVVSQRLRSTVWQDAGIACGVGLVVVFLMLLWEMEGPRGALLCLVPVLLGVLWTVAAMAALGLALNFLNVFVITMIIGVGVDYGIHMLHRLREGGGIAAVAETSRAVVFAAMTTVVGFGSLITTHFPGLQSIGWMTSTGVVFTCVVAVVLLPLLVRPDVGEEPRQGNPPQQ